MICIIMTIITMMTKCSAFQIATTAPSQLSAFHRGISTSSSTTSSSSSRLFYTPPPPHYDDQNPFSSSPQSSQSSTQQPQPQPQSQPQPTIITTKTEVTPTGEADRAFQNALTLEKAGQTRSAHAYFHSSATLYQCYLDSNYSSSDITTTSSSEFAHVTTLSSDACLSSLAYACTRLAYLSLDTLGDPRAATRLYKDAIGILTNQIRPKESNGESKSNMEAEAYDGMGMAIESSGRIKRGTLMRAVDAYCKGLALGGGSSGYILFHLAVALERMGAYKDDNDNDDITNYEDGIKNNRILQDLESSEEIMERLRRDEAKYACLVDSWGYVRWHTRRIPTSHLNLYLGTRSMLQIALEAAMPLIVEDGGLVCEFGVATGRSLRMMQEILPLSVPVHGFDTFMGLPMAWGDEPAGAYSTGGVLPNLQGEVYFHRGLFKDTIPDFLNGLEEEYQPLAFANIDCDLYGSTLNILEAMHSRVVPGTVLVFDEYLCHPTWRQDEFRAWRECCKRFGWQYEYLGFSLGTKQAVVRVTSA